MTQINGRRDANSIFDQQDISTAAENDLEQATALARQIAARCGMSAKLGLANFACDNPGGPWPRAVGPTERCSEATARIIDEEVRPLLDEARERLMQTVRDKRVLLDREVLEHAALVSLTEGGDASQMK